MMTFLEWLEQSDGYIYRSTSLKVFQNIQKRGFLKPSWRYKGASGNEGKVIYFSEDPEESKGYGKGVMLRVKKDSVGAELDPFTGVMGGYYIVRRPIYIVRRPIAIDLIEVQADEPHKTFILVGDAVLKGRFVYHKNYDPEVAA